jgi:hypothetical protein
MKNIVLAFLFLCPTFLWADSWDNLTFEQAEQVTEYLANDPYIFDYCDCCDHEGQFATEIHLFKVISTEVVTCDWNTEYFSVKAQVEVLAKIPYKESGPDITDPHLIPYESIEEFTITMNYTWGLNKETGKAAPIYTIIPYDIYGNQSNESGYCKDFTTFPSPEVMDNEAYKKWYNERM